MPERRKLTATEIETALAELPGWSVANGKLHKEFKFASFSVALGWMVSVGIFADKIDHHPEWFNVYNRVVVDLATHDLDNSISYLDIKLARRMEKLTSS